MSYQKPPIELVPILEAYPHNKKAFEYLTMFMLLYQDVIGFYEMMEKYYADMHYEKMPRYIQEGILTSVYVFKDTEFTILQKYPVDKETVERFENHNRDFELVKAGRASKKMLKEKHGDTFFYYYLNRKPMLLEQIYQMQSIY